MTVTDCDIAVNTDDWYVSSVAGRIDGTTTLRSERNNILFPNNSATAYGDVDTSVIPTTDVISSAVLHFYVHSITKPKRGNVTSYIYMLSANETTWSLINSQLNPTVGWNTVTLTAGEIAQIDTGASQKTRFRWSTDDPGASKANAVVIRAREYATVDTYDMFLRVTHEEPSTYSGAVISVMTS